MSIVALLNIDDPMYGWEHAMAHRTSFAVMGPLHQWSALPYFIDPVIDQKPARSWALNHQRAHDDFMAAVPAGYEQTTVGIPINQILKESNLANKESRTWFSFANNMEHYIANNAMLPLPNTGTRTGHPSSFPWWIPAPRWTLPPYW